VRLSEKLIQSLIGNLVGRNHLGVDIDGDNARLKALMTFFNARQLYPDKEIKVYRTGRGYHVKVLGITSNIKVRRILGDDAMRIEFSEERMKAFNRPYDDVLFQVKRYGRRVSREEEINILSEIWFSRWKFRRIPRRRKNKENKEIFKNLSIRLNDKGNFIRGDIYPPFTEPYQKGE